MLQIPNNRCDDNIVIKPLHFLYRKNDKVTDDSRSYKLLSGLMGLGVYGDGGDNFTIVGIVCANEYFGDEVILKTERRRHEAIALVKSVVTCVTLDSNKKDKLYSDSIRRNERLETLYSIRRVAKRVEYVNSFLGYRLPYTRLAEIVSATPETVADSQRLIEKKKK